jgi:hypothetical protein
MAMPNGFEIELIEDPDNPGEVLLAAIVANRQVSDLVQAIEYVRGAGAVAVMEVEGAVGSNVWTSVGTLDATKQFEVDAIYNRIRVRVTTGGALGTGHKLFYYGKS